MNILVSQHILENNQKFFKVTQGAYLFGLIGHALSIFSFSNMGVHEMAIFNASISVPAFAIALLFNYKGRHNLGFLFAFLELLFHQIATTYYLGWGFGAHYWLIYLAGLSFFNSQWNIRTQLSLLLIVTSTYVSLFVFFQEGVYAFDQATQEGASLGNAITVLINV